VDQRVEPPSWLPDGAAGSDAKGPVSHDSADDDLDSDGLDSQGLDSQGLDSQGLDSQGLDSQGLDSQGLDSQGLDSDGLDSQGLDSQGLDSQGLDSQGPLTLGSASHDPAAPGSASHDPASHDPASPGSAGYDPAGYDPASPGSAGYDPAGYDPAKYDSAKYDPAKYDSARYDPASAKYDSARYDPASAKYDSAKYGSASYGSGGSGLGTQGSAMSANQGSAGDQPSRDPASDGDSYSYAGERWRSNGQDAAFGQEGTALSAYGQESGLGGSAGSAGSAPPYPAQFSDPLPAAEKTSGPRPRTAVFSAAPRKAKAGGTQGRRADLVLSRLEPWSVMKFSFLISLVAWVMLFVAVAVLWFALDALGVFTSVQKTLESVTSSSGSAGVSLTKWFSASRILGYTMLIGAVNIILITALSTVGSMIYNLVTHLGGGIEITLRESD
jgi:Transmembrane domain of unknown function (DUF3566)